MCVSVRVCALDVQFTITALEMKYETSFYFMGALNFYFN